MKVSLRKNIVYPNPLASLWPMQTGMQRDSSLSDLGSSQGRLSRGSWVHGWYIWVTCIEYLVKTAFSPISLTGHENKYYLLTSKNFPGAQSIDDFPCLLCRRKELLTPVVERGGGGFCGLFSIIPPQTTLSGVLKSPVTFDLWREFTVSYAIKQSNLLRHTTLDIPRHIFAPWRGSCEGRLVITVTGSAWGRLITPRKVTSWRAFAKGTPFLLIDYTSGWPALAERLSVSLTFCWHMHFFFVVGGVHARLMWSSCSWKGSEIHTTKTQLALKGERKRDLLSTNTITVSSA